MDKKTLAEKFRKAMEESYVHPDYDYGEVIAIDDIQEEQTDDQ